MEFHRIIPGSSLYRQVYDLYLEAFPPEERQQFGRLWLLSVLRKSVELLACCDEAGFCGFVITVSSRRYLYIPFVAVSSARRGQGLGSKLLTALRQRHNELALLVEIEAPDPTAPNQQQRLERLRFYERNGFTDLQKNITGRGVTYTLLSTDPDYDREAYFALFDELSFGKRRLELLLKQCFGGKS